MTGEAGAVDPVVVEIVRRGVIAVTEEMKTNLTRTAYNVIIYEALDFTVGLFTAKGDTVSIGMGLPMFIRGMGDTVKAKLAHFGADGLEPGDILITNDPYVSGSHLYHVMISMPVFHEGELVAWTSSMAHWLDIGGVLAGVTTDIYSEGLQIPFLKLYRAGEINRDLVDIIRMNCRIPERALGDMRAQVTGVKTGERRFLELIGRYGKDAVLGAIEAILERSEHAARARTRSIPDGTYEAESFMDDDGLTTGKPIPLKVRVTVAGDEMTVDLSEVSPQVRGFFNSGPSTGVGCAQVAYKCLTSPTDYPLNDGSLRGLKVILPPGRVVSAVRPAPMRWWMTVPMTIIDTIFKAMLPAIPERTIAGHHADLVIVLINGFLPKDRRLFIGTVGPTGGGWGAKKNEDGVSATICINDGDTHNSPLEMLETKYPLLIHRQSLIPDSGGAGRRRGGLGVETVVEARSEMNISSFIERKHCEPWGLDGGHAGLGNQLDVFRQGAKQPELPNAKIVATRLAPGDGFVVRGGGGGGFGDPKRREPARVLEDVRQGYVTPEAAERLYGVKVDRQ